MEFKHIPVLLKECIEGLNIKENGIYVDGTLGGAGHSIEILKKLKNGLLIGIDRDKQALKAAQEKLSEFKNVEYVYGNHDDIKEILESKNINGVDGILLDLGVSSYQLDEATRGFSYMKDSSLDMRMDLSSELTAKKVVNTYSEEKLADIFFRYGEEKFAKRIARRICEVRNKKEIETTQELVKIIEEAVPKNNKKEGHPAKKVFQAIRIEVNDELNPLYNTVKNCIEVLNPKGRLCIITFHSLEDRIVKKAYTDAIGKCICPSDFPYCVCGRKQLGIIINKKPIIASEMEMNENSRSKSAKLRIFEKI